MRVMGEYIMIQFLIIIVVICNLNFTARNEVEAR